MDNNIEDNDRFKGWVKFSDEKPSYNFDAIVVLDDGGTWIASWTGKEWDFSTPHLFVFGRKVTHWMAMPDLDKQYVEIKKDK